MFDRTRCIVRMRSYVCNGAWRMIKVRVWGEVSLEIDSTKYTPVSLCDKIDSSGTINTKLTPRKSTIKLQK